MKTLTITSAIALTDAQKKELVAAIEKKHGKLKIVEVVDEKVLGGVKVTIGSEQIDATVSGKLSQLQN